MTHSAADQRRVFLAYRTVFVGAHAQIRKPKKVREIVLQHESSFRPLTKDFGTEKIISIIQSLLQGRIFQSELQAKIAFPELFKTSLSRDVQRTASENDAARSEAEALEELLSSSEGEEGDDNGEDVPETSRPAATKAISLFPSYLPYKSQHVILTTAQHQLEECCFEFATKWLPSLLEEKGWDCAEAVELTKWTRTLAPRCDKLPAHALDHESDATLKEIFLSTNILRHSAVHRLSTSVTGIQKMIQSASNLAKTLGDYPRAAKLEYLHLEIGNRIKDMELNKNFLENRLDEQLHAISEQRAELDRREKDAIAATIKEDRENKVLVGSFLETLAAKAFAGDEPGSVDLDGEIGEAHMESDENDEKEEEDRNGNVVLNDSEGKGHTEVEPEQINGD